MKKEYKEIKVTLVPMQLGGMICASGDGNSVTKGNANGKTTFAPSFAD